MNSCALIGCRPRIGFASMRQEAKQSDGSNEANSERCRTYQKHAKAILKMRRQGGKVSVAEFARKHGLRAKTLAKHLKQIREYRLATLSPIDSPKKKAGGRPPYISRNGVKALNLMVETLDVCGRPCTPQLLLVLMKKIRIYENPGLDPEKVLYPSKSTSARIQALLTVPLRSLRVGEDVRRSKSKEHYLAETYAKLRALDEKYHFLDKDKYVPENVSA